MVRFDPTEGVEISKTRPAVIIHNDIGNRFSDLTIAAASRQLSVATPSAAMPDPA